MRGCHTLTGAGCNVNHNAGLLPIFGRGRAGNDLQGLDRIQWNLVRKHLALLVGDWLVIQGK